MALPPEPLDQVLPLADKQVMITPLPLADENAALAPKPLMLPPLGG